MMKEGGRMSTEKDYSKYFQPPSLKDAKNAVRKISKFIITLKSLKSLERSVRVKIYDSHVWLSDE